MFKCITSVDLGAKHHRNPSRLRTDVWRNSHHADRQLSQLWVTARSLHCWPEVQHSEVNDTEGCSFPQQALQSATHSSHSVQIKSKISVSTRLSVVFSVPDRTGTLSSIVCLTSAAAGAGEVPVKVVIDNFQVTTTKMFSYKENPVVTSVQPHCSLQR